MGFLLLKFGVSGATWKLSENSQLQRPSKSSGIGRMLFKGRLFRRGLIWGRLRFERASHTSGDPDADELFGQRGGHRGREHLAFRRRAEGEADRQGHA